MLYNFRRLNETNNTKIAVPVNTMHAAVCNYEHFSKKFIFFLNHL